MPGGIAEARIAVSDEVKARKDRAHMTWVEIFMVGLEEIERRNNLTEIAPGSGDK